MGTPDDVTLEDEVSALPSDRWIHPGDQRAVTQAEAAVGRAYIDWLGTPGRTRRSALQAKIRELAMLKGRLGLP